MKGTVLWPHRRSGPIGRRPTRSVPRGRSSTWAAALSRERVAFEALATEIMRVQLKNRKAARAHGVRHGVDRAFHAKTTFAVDDAELRFLDLPPDLRVGFAQPGAAYPAAVRFCNAAGTVRPDREPDLRGVALRVTVSPDEQHDLLMTNSPVSHARDARQFVEFAVATAGGAVSRVVGLAAAGVRLGPRETVRMVRNVLAGRARHRAASRPRPTGAAARSAGARRSPCGTCCGPARHAGRAAAGRHDPDFLAHEVADRLARRRRAVRAVRAALPRRRGRRRSRTRPSTGGPSAPRRRSRSRC